MIPAFSVAFGQLGDPPIRAVIWRVALWTAMIFAALGWGLWSLISGFDPSSSLGFIPFDWLREPLVAALGFIVAVIGGFVVFALFWLLFASVVQFVSGFYLERVVVAVEARHYPDLPPARGPGVGETLIATARFFGLLVALNLLALPFYLIPTLGLAVFYLLNGYLLGRENFELVAMRRLDARVMGRLRRRHRGRLLIAGLIVTVLMSLPLVNLIAPIVAAAAMAHLFMAMPGALDGGAPGGGADLVAAPGGNDGHAPTSPR